MSIKGLGDGEIVTWGAVMAALQKEPALKVEAWFDAEGYYEDWVNVTCEFAPNTVLRIRVDRADSHNDINADTKADLQQMLKDLAP